MLQERIERLRKWKDKFYGVTYWIFVLILLIEIIMYFFLSLLGLMEDSPGAYIVRYLLLPSGTNILVLLLQFFVRKKFPEKVYLISVWPVFTIVHMCSVIACVHCVFPAVLSIFCVPICMTVVYEDERLTKIMFAVSMVCLSFATFFRGVSGYVPPEDNTYLIPDAVVSAITVIVCFFVALMLVRLFEEKDADLIRSRQEAEEANSSKSLFLSNMSHEIRTPMNAIIGMTDVIMRKEHSPEETGYLMNIKNSGAALITIINDILDLSKIESGKMEIIEQDYEPMSMINDLGMIFWNRIGEKDIELIFDIDSRLPERLNGDSLRIRQIIVNLMNNATKFTEEGRVKLEIKILEQSEGEVKLRYGISDTGQGIREEDKERLFGAFAQVNAEANHAKEGTGLGLSISKQLVTLMGGSIGVESEFGKGSEFYFIIPQKIVQEKPAAQILEENRALTVSGKWKNPYMAEEFGKLVQEYSMTCLRDVTPPDVDFFFTDDEAWVKQEEVQEQARKGAKICLLQNPMQPDGHASSVTIANKPLYSLNFCQIINREETGGQFSTEDYINFRAPEASILLVDDNEMNRIVAVSLLEPIQMQIDLAEDGKEAVEKIMQKRYDLVLMDHMMPVMDGIEATKAVRSMEGEYYQSLPIIALTANAMSDARKKFVEAGMNDFVAKPIELKEVCAKIKHWLPEEKIQKRILQPEELEKRKAEESIAVPDIQGLDKDEGVKNSGSKELFLQLLGDFYRLIDAKSNKIEKCLADGMIRDYTIEVHAMKNTARMIGAMELSELFYQMEKYGNEENVEALQRETPGVLALYRSYKEILKPFAKKANGKKEEITAQDLVLKLDMLKNAVLDFDLDTADDVMGELEKISVPAECEEQMEQLGVYYADLAMDEITKACENMIAVLQKE